MTESKGKLKSLGRGALGIIGLGFEDKPEVPVESKGQTLSVQANIVTPPSAVVSDIAGVDEKICKDYYDIFLERLQKTVGSAFFLFRKAKDSLSKYIKDDRSLYQAAAESVTTQNGLLVTQIANDCQNVKSALEAIAKEELGNMDEGKNADLSSRVRETGVLDKDIENLDKQVQELSKRKTEKIKTKENLDAEIVELRAKLQMHKACLTEAYNRLQADLNKDKEGINNFALAKEATK
jgi:hypothetical protein